jgi:hypothetical protein
MVPSRFVMLETLPLTPSGKVDRRALPAPDSSRPEEAPYTAPRTPVEATLAEIWAEVLRQRQIGIHDDFFASGGHSLIATQILSRVRDVFQVELPLHVFFLTPTVAGLAGALQEHQANGGTPPAPSITPAARARRRGEQPPMVPS